MAPKKITTSGDTSAFWAKMLPRYEKLLAEAKTEKDRDSWKKRIAEAKEKANPTSPNQDEHHPD